MSWLGRILQAGTGAPRPGPLDDYWYRPLTRPSAGMSVTPDSALGTSAVYRAVTLLAADLAGLPLHVYRRAERGKRRAADHYLEPILTGKPNPWQSQIGWREMVMGHLLLRGNAYNRIVPGTDAWIGGLVPMHPGRMRVEQLESGRLRYRYRRADGREEVLTQDEVWHLRGFSMDGICGIGLVELARLSIGLTMAAEEFGAQQFGKRPMISGVLRHPGQFKDEETARRIGRSFQEAFGGPSAWHSVPVLEEGLEWQQVGMTNEDAQFLETRKFQVSDIARWFGVPPHMIGDLERATFSNIEHQSIDYVRHGLMHWLRRWESQIAADLILEPEYFAEFKVAGLLRADTKTRAESYKIAIESGWMTRNEVREAENLDPLPGLDRPIMPLNMVEVGAAGSGQAAPPDALAVETAHQVAELLARRDRIEHLNGSSR